MAENATRKTIDSMSATLLKLHDTAATAMPSRKKSNTSILGAMHSFLDDVEEIAADTIHTVVDAISSVHKAKPAERRRPTEAEKEEYYLFLMKLIKEKHQENLEQTQRRVAIKSTGDITVEGLHLLAATYHYLPALKAYLSLKLDVGVSQPLGQFIAKDNARALITLTRFLRNTPEQERSQMLMNIVKAISPTTLNGIVALAEKYRTAELTTRSTAQEQIAKVISKPLLVYLHTAIERAEQLDPSGQDSNSFSH